MGRKAKARVAAEYTWNKICGQYEEVFVKNMIQIFSKMVNVKPI